jgi:hypothetical protein
VTTAYRLADLERVRADAAALRATGAEADALRIAEQRARTIELLLRANGLLPMEDALPAPEAIEQLLDRAYPRARHREVVSYGGRHYRRRILPKDKAADGRVLSWSRSWEPASG